MARQGKRQQVAQSEAPLTIGLVQRVKLQDQENWANEFGENFASQESRFQSNMVAVPIQRKTGTPETTHEKEVKRPNNTGLPENLKAGLEQLSGLDMSDVRVHYNSSKPAQLNALAYTQGTDIHVGPGQEQYLSHEGWHVVQQIQRRVQPKKQIKGTNVNDDEVLEREADVMGEKAKNVPIIDSILQLKCTRCQEDDKEGLTTKSEPLLRKANNLVVVQRAYGCYFFKSAGCTGIKRYAQSKHNFRDWKSWNCTGKAESDDCVVNDGKGHCACPEKPEEDVEKKPTKPLSAYDDPTTSEFSRALIERGLETGGYPPRH